MLLMYIISVFINFILLLISISILKDVINRHKMKIIVLMGSILVFLYIAGSILLGMVTVASIALKYVRSNDEKSNKVTNSNQYRQI